LPHGRGATKELENAGGMAVVCRSSQGTRTITAGFGVGPIGRILKKRETEMPGNSEIIEACRRAFSGFEKNDKTALLSLLADSVVFEFPTSLPYGGRYVGTDEFKAFWADLYENYYAIPSQELT